MVGGCKWGSLGMYLFTCTFLEPTDSVEIREDVVEDNENDGDAVEVFDDVGVATSSSTSGHLQK
jgi:hypothetical protein